jgi:hypothetical protein
MIAHRCVKLQPIRRYNPPQKEPHGSSLPFPCLLFDWCNQILLSLTESDFPDVQNFG